MTNKDTGYETTEVEEIVAAEPISEAAVGDVVEAVSGVVVARREGEETAETPSPLAGEGGGEGEEIPPHKNGHLKHVLECMLFVSTEPLGAAQLAQALGIEESAVEEEMRRLEEHLDASSGLQLMRVAGGYQLCTRAEFADYCAMILQPARKKLSRAALETLAIVAYRQPCTVPEIEAVRGVNVDGVIKTLVERELIKEAGRKQTPGRPVLYATTAEFLEYFGLNDLTELPDIEMLAVDEIKALEAQREALGGMQPKEEDVDQD